MLIQSVLPYDKLGDIIYITYWLYKTREDRKELHNLGQRMNIKTLSFKINSDKSLNWSYSKPHTFRNIPYQAIENL